MNNEKVLVSTIYPTKIPYLLKKKKFCHCHYGVPLKPKFWQGFDGSCGLLNWLKWYNNLLLIWLVCSLYSFLLDYCIIIWHEHPTFNQENQDPKWKKAVIVWNSKYAKGNEIETFYKVCSLLELVNWCWLIHFIAWGSSHLLPLHMKKNYHKPSFTISQTK